MALTVSEMACRYLEKIPGAVSGSGGHTQTFTTACALVKGFDLTVDEARPLLHSYNQRCNPPWTDAELEHKLRQADGVADDRQRGWLRLENVARDDAGDGRRSMGSAPLPVAPPAKATFQPETLKATAARWREFIDTAWLADRSPVMTFPMTAEEYLAAVFREGEKVVVFTNQESQGQAMWPLQKVPTTGPNGVWYLDQPVDGREHPNPRTLDPKTGGPKLSRRSEESITDWRHLVLESDEADARDWMGALVQLPLRIVAIYTSGGRSIHALVRIDAPTKEEWDNCVKRIRPVLVTLGACRKALTAVRLTRLPGCWREEKGKLQKLLYLDPAAQPGPICTRPRLRDVLAGLLSFGVQVLESSRSEVLETVGEKGLTDLFEALEWYESARPAREMLSKLRKWTQAAEQLTEASA